MWCVTMQSWGFLIPHPAALAAVVRIATQAVFTAQHLTPGPVHINARFRKPLE